MNFVDELLEDGGRFIAQRRGAEVTFHPASNEIADLESFQAVVHRLREHEGDGYRIIRDDLSSDHGGGLIDAIVLLIAKH